MVKIVKLNNEATKDAYESLRKNKTVLMILKSLIWHSFCYSVWLSNILIL